MIEKVKRKWNLRLAVSPIFFGLAILALLALKVAPSSASLRSRVQSRIRVGMTVGEVETALGLKQRSMLLEMRPLESGCVAKLNNRAIWSLFIPGEQVTLHFDGSRKVVNATYEVLVGVFEEHKKGNIPLAPPITGAGRTE